MPRHAFSAVLKAGELPTLAGAIIAILTDPPPGVVVTWGSGKSATPCWRMQRE
jgi:hypothetical protein